MPDEEEQEPVTKPINVRTVIFIVIGILIIAGIWYGYYWINSTQKKITQAENVILKAANFDSLSEKIQNEFQRCQAFIAQEQGQFGEFEYCKGFINWVNTNASEVE